ncbi:MAG: hypothetical protein IT342_24065 [Candidatus Melainabacteria bacterium]|nr:hypothetical protein [Candidatus Melainabacteria bacterium]
MSLNLKLKELIALKEERDAARERWQALLSQSDEGHFAARREHLRLDDAYEGKVQELFQLVISLCDEGCLEDEMENVTREDKPVLEHLLSERGMLALLYEDEDSGGNDLDTLVPRWRAASTNLDAAQRLNIVRQQEGQEGFDGRLAEETERFRVPEAFARAVSVLRQLLGSIPEDDARDADDRLADAIWYMVRTRRSRLDKAAEKLQSVLQNLFDSGMLDYALSELDFDLAKAVRDAVAGGFILQRQLQPETKPQARPVELLDRTDTEADEDEY